MPPAPRTLPVSRLRAESSFALLLGVMSRFPKPWSVRELEHAFVVSDANGRALAYTYFRRTAKEAREAGVLRWDEARRIAADIAKIGRDPLPQIVEAALDRPEVKKRKTTNGEI